MNLTKTEMIDLIYSCTNVDKSTIEKEIWSTVNMHDNYISFSLNPAYYVLSRERKESRKENFVKIPTVTGVILLSKGRPGATRIE